MDDESRFATAKAAFDSTDYEACRTLLEPLAESGFAPAQCLLGCLYHLGLGVPEDLTLALQWYREASDGGYAVASNNLGTMLYSGQGIASDIKEARRFYKKAAEQGFVHAPPGE
ncbi:sel1 repeat family protein [bacterium]|nr:MAG: sel1 repeat family protein [bacterium]